MGEYDYEKPVAPIPKPEFSLAELFGNLSPVENEPTNFRGAIYSLPGLGKTFAGIELAQRITPPDQLIVHVFTGTNWDSYKDVPALRQRVWKKPYKNMDELVAFVEKLADPQAMSQLPVKIGCVVFDEHNTMFDEDIDRITSENALLLWKEKQKYKDPHTPEWPDRNMAKYHMKAIMETTLKVPDTHFIFLCHERDGKVTFAKEPDYFNAASQEFMRPLSCLYRLTTGIQDGKVVRTFQTQGTDQVIAKNRITGVPAFVSGDGAIATIATCYNNWSKAEREKQLAQQAPVEKPKEPEQPVPVQEKTEPLPPVTEPEASPQEPKQESDTDKQLRELLGL